MAFIHVYNYSYAPVPGSAVSGSVSLTADSETSVDEAIAVANDQLINIAIDVSEIQGFIIKSSKDCEVYTNDTSGGSPDDNISLTANVPVIFFDGGPLANPSPVMWM